MKIAVAGGIGIENSLINNLKGHKVYLVGCLFNIQKEKFVPPQDVEFTAEYITHNYRTIFSDFDLFIDITDNLKSKFLINDFAVKYQKNSIILFYDASWKVFIGSPQNACLHCILSYKKPDPPFLLPQIPEEKFYSIVKRYLELPKKESFLFDLEKDSEKIVLKTDNCPVCGQNGGHYYFINGETADIVSVSCGDNSVSITPMNEVTIDLKQYREYFISQNKKNDQCLFQPNEIKIIKENPFFLEFRIAHINAVLFRQGRLVVKGTKDKSTAQFIYRRYIGG